MNIIAGIHGYNAAAGVLMGAAVFCVAALLQGPSDIGKTAAKPPPPPPLMRAADRKASDAFRGKPPGTASAATKAAPPASAATTGQAQTNEAQPATKQVKVNKPKPKKPNVRPTRELEDGTALGFADPPRGFVSPFFR